MTVERVCKIQENLTPDTALLVTSEANRFYLTGFHSSAGVVVVTKEKSYFLIDFRYVEKAKSVVKSCEVILSSRSESEVLELLKKYFDKKVHIFKNRSDADVFLESLL